MKRMLPILALMLFVCPSPAHALIPLENRIATDDADGRALLDRLEKVLARTEKRMQEVFGIVPQAVAVAGPSQEAYDFQFSSPGAASKGQAGILMINTRVVREYGLEDLQIAAARSLYQAVWPKFRKPYTTDHALIARLYAEGMTAYAAELIVPRAAPWKYAGLFVTEGRTLYSRYLDNERRLSGAVLQTIRIGTERERLDEFFPLDEAVRAHWSVASGHLLSYRIMKTFEKDMDPKMVQLMGFDEFRDRLSRCLEVLHKGFGRKEFQ